MLKRLIPIFVLPVVFVGCTPSNKSITDYKYFEKNLDSLSNVVVRLKEPTIQKHDLLQIMISSASLIQEQVAVFNMLAGGAAGGAGAGGSMATQGYLVDYDGSITIPVLGAIPVEGLTKAQLIQLLKQKLVPYVKNPVVNIRFLSFRVMLMGEVGTTGWISFANEKATIVDAIGQAGGITEQGLRSNILLIRQEPGGNLETHRLDMNDALVYQSPYFQLQQNDVIYVLPNNSKLIQYQRTNSPFFRDLPVYMGLIASILAFVTLIVSITR